jgi:hypothetical protein
MTVQVYQLHSLNRVEFDRLGRVYLSDIPGAESCPANRWAHNTGLPALGPRRNLRWKYWPDQCNNAA